MEDIVKLVAERTGISEAQARSAVETIVGFLKERLPSPLDNQVEMALGADLGGLAQQAQSMIPGGLGNLGGMLGGKTER